MSEQSIDRGSSKKPVDFRVLSGPSGDPNTFAARRPGNVPENGEEILQDNDVEDEDLDPDLKDEDLEDLKDEDLDEAGQN